MSEQVGRAAMNNAAKASGALERAQQLRALIVGNTKAYHAYGPGERARMRAGLRLLRERVTHAHVAGRKAGQPVCCGRGMDRAIRPTWSGLCAKSHGGVEDLLGATEGFGSGARVAALTLMPSTPASLGRWS